MTVNIEVPKIGESVATVFIAQWIKQPGDVVVAGDPIVEVDSDKASMEVPAPVDGVLMETLAAEGEEVAIGVVIGRIDDTADVSAAKSATNGTSEPAAEAPASEVRAGPAARQLASQTGVALTDVQGTGKHGRVLTEDIRKAAQEDAGIVVEPLAQTKADLAERVKRVPCLLYTSPSPRDGLLSRMPSSA